MARTKQSQVKKKDEGLRVDAVLHARLALIANLRGVPLRAVTDEAIAEYLASPSIKPLEKEALVAFDRARTKP